MKIEDCFKDWLTVINKKDILGITDKVAIQYYEKDVTPKFEDVFRAFELCDYNNCKVVILGMDCYPQKGVATGIAFGNKAGTSVNKWSPSLKVLVDCFNFNNESYDNFDCTLEGLGRQGVLLLNSALTCETGKPGSHLLSWRPFIAKFLAVLSIKKEGIAYILLGKDAQSFESYIYRNNNFILTEKHPSYYARINQSMPNNVFIAANYWLQKQSCENTINWFNLK